MKSLVSFFLSVLVSLIGVHSTSVSPPPLSLTPILKLPRDLASKIMGTCPRQPGESPRKSRSTEESWVENLPGNVYREIGNRLNSIQINALKQTSKVLNQLCNDDSERISRAYYIGKTPTFMPAVKRCLINDDVDCYKFVVKYFKAKGLIENHHLAQLPALAATHGASYIFLELKVSSSHTHWQKWMTRAASNGQYQFIYDMNFNEGEPKKKEYSPLSPYDVPVLSSDHEYEVHTLSKPKVPISLDEKLAPAYTYTFDESMWNKHLQLQKCPSILDISHALNKKVKVEREQALADLQSRIKEVLEDGIYTIDDVIMSPNNTFLLWEKNIKSAKARTTDTVRYNFTLFLFDEGAPFDDLSLLRSYLRVPDDCIKYGSGSPIMSLIRLLQDGALIKKQNELLLRKLKSQGANILDPVVLLTTLYNLVEIRRPREDDDWMKEFFQMSLVHDIMEFFIREGVTQNQLDILRKYVNQENGPLKTDLNALLDDLGTKMSFYQENGNFEEYR